MAERQAFLVLRLPHGVEVGEEEGPWELVREAVAAEGLELLVADSERHVRVPAGLEKAQELGLTLHEQVRQQFGLELRVGAAVGLDDARRTARGLLVLPRRSRAAATTTTTTSGGGGGSGGGGEGAVEAGKGKRQVHTCQICRACYFDPGALRAHVEQRHSGRGKQQHGQHQDQERRRHEDGARRDGGSGGHGLRGPGQVAFTDVLTALTDPDAIEAFLRDVGAEAGAKEM